MFWRWKSFRPKVFILKKYNSNAYLHLCRYFFSLAQFSFRQFPNFPSGTGVDMIKLTCWIHLPCGALAGEYGVWVLEHFISTQGNGIEKPVALSKPKKAHTTKNNPKWRIPCLYNGQTRVFSRISLHHFFNTLSIGQYMLSKLHT